MCSYLITIVDKESFVNFLSLASSGEYCMFKVFTSSMAQLYKLLRLYRQGCGSIPFKVVPVGERTCYLCVCPDF